MPATTQGFQPVAALMHRIADSGNAFPKVRLAFGDSPLVLTVAGAKAKCPGAINLTDGKRYGEGAFFGRITPAGEFEPGRDARALPQDGKRALWDLLTRMRDGQAESVFAEYGKKFGSCCMCGRDLTNAESVALGIGPICRNRAFA